MLLHRVCFKFAASNMFSMYFQLIGAQSFNIVELVSGLSSRSRTALVTRNKKAKKLFSFRAASDAELTGEDAACVKIANGISRETFNHPMVPTTGFGADTNSQRRPLD